jgi:hypothetical protein
MSITKSPQLVPNTKLRAEINASLEAAMAEAERVGYVSLEEADRKAEELLKRLDAEFADRSI